VKLVVFLLALKLFAIDDSYWAKKETVYLQKDEVALFDVNKKRLFFRWTLFKNRGIVLHYNYDGYVNQNILYKEYRRDGFKIFLKQYAINSYFKPYIMIIFKGYKSKIATFDLYLYDPDSIFKIKRVKNVR